MLAYGMPKTVADPEVGRTRPSTIRIVVLLPAPLGPRKPVTHPGRASKVRSSTACTRPKRFVSPRAAIAGDPIGRTTPEGAWLVVVSIIVVVLLRDPFPSGTTLGRRRHAGVGRRCRSDVLLQDDGAQAPGWTRPDS